MKIGKRYNVTFYLFGETEKIFDKELIIECEDNVNFSKSYLARKFLEELQGFNKQKIVIISIDG